MPSLSDQKAYENKLKRDFDNYLELAEYFKNQGQISEAIEKFVLAIEQYAELNYATLSGSDYFKNEIKIGSFFTLYSLFKDLFNYLVRAGSKYPDRHIIMCYLIRNMRILQTSLTELRSSFRVDDFKIYDKVCSHLKEDELFVTKSVSGKSIDDELEKIEKLIKSTKPDKTHNEILKSIRTSLSTISEVSLFPKFESKLSACFVATAAYSSSTHPDLDTFRKFRDRTLLTNPLGRLFVSVYYQIGSQLAWVVNRSFYLKKIVRFLLEKLAFLMRICGI